MSIALPVQTAEPDGSGPLPYRDHGAARRGLARTGVIALMDGEFWRWWQDTPRGQPERDVVIAARQAVRDALMQTRDGLTLQRMVWVAEARTSGLDDVRIVLVSGDEQEEGWPLVRALSQALFDVAAGGVVHTVLLATDDDRLLPAIDEVQRRGLRVLMLQGEERKLSDEWRRLLACADRCLHLGEARAARANRPDRERDDRYRSVAASSSADHPDRSQDPAFEPPSSETLHKLNEAASHWWSALDDDARQSLREALPQSRGLPRDLDRQLLISAARSLDRQLSVPEKHALRGAARAAAGGETGSGSGPTASDSVALPDDRVASDHPG